MFSYFYKSDKQEDEISISLKKVESLKEELVTHKKAISHLEIIKSSEELRKNYHELKDKVKEKSKANLKKLKDELKSLDVLIKENDPLLISLKEIAALKQDIINHKNNQSDLEKQWLTLKNPEERRLKMNEIEKLEEKLEDLAKIYEKKNSFFKDKLVEMQIPNYEALKIKHNNNQNEKEKEIFFRLISLKEELNSLEKIIKQDDVISMCIKDMESLIKEFILNQKVRSELENIWNSEENPNEKKTIMTKIENEEEKFEEITNSYQVNKEFFNEQLNGRKIENYETLKNILNNNNNQNSIKYVQLSKLKDLKEKLDSLDKFIKYEDMISVSIKEIESLSALSINHQRDRCELEKQWKDEENPEKKRTPMNKIENLEEKFDEITKIYEVKTQFLNDQLSGRKNTDYLNNDKNSIKYVQISKLNNLKKELVSIEKIIKQDDFISIYIKNVESLKAISIEHQKVRSEIEKKWETAENLEEKKNIMHQIESCEEKLQEITKAYEEKTIFYNQYLSSRKILSHEALVNALNNIHDKK